MVREAVSLIANGSAPRVTQPEFGASYEALLNKHEQTLIPLNELSGQALHNFIRGMDKVPGAITSH